MRKLNFLKTIFDYIWIISIICYPIIIVVCATMLISSNPIDLPIKIAGNSIELNTIWNKIGMIISLLNFGVMLYALYNFKIVLLNFKNKLIFEVETCNVLDKIGNLIIYSSVLYVITELLLLISKNTVSIQIGFGPFLYLIALGLFFKVLSEVFVIGKRIKEESDLTI